MTETAGRLTFSGIKELDGNMPENGVIWWNLEVVAWCSGQILEQVLGILVLVVSA